MSRRPLFKKCATKFCRSLAHIRRDKNGHCHSERLCAKCKARLWKANHPIHYQYNKLRNRAKERGHGFTLTLEQFTEFVQRTDYMLYKGKTAKSLSINRIRNEEGYHADNIEVLPLSQNSRLAKAPIEVREKYQFRWGLPRKINLVPDQVSPPT